MSSPKWTCEDCGKEYWSNKSACGKCGSSDVFIDKNHESDEIDGFFKSLTMKQYIIVLVFFSLLSAIVFFGMIFAGDMII